MRIAVMGAGAVGCCYGAWFAKAGHEVALIGRPGFAEAVNSRGLIFESGGATETIAVQASADPAAAAGADLLLHCVKSKDTEEAGAALAPHLPRTAVAISFQNGVGNAERLAAVLGRPVAPAAVYVAADMGGVGHVRHHGRGDVIFGEIPRRDEILAAFASAGIEATCSADAVSAQWGKLVANCAYNALSAITRLPYGGLVEQAGVPGVIETVIAECAAVAAAEGVTLPETVAENVRSIPLGMPGQFSSTAQDLMAGKPVEIAYLNGEIARRGARHGIATPVNATLTALVLAIEARQNAG